MNISPSFICNFSCDFCCLKNRPGKLLDLGWVEDQFKAHPEMARNVDILGGEPSLLPVEYQKRLIDLCVKYGGKKPYFTTNLYNITPLAKEVDLIVSYDFKMRKHSSRVLNNLLSLNTTFSLSTILSQELVENVGVEKFLKFIDNLKNCISVDLLIYFNRDTDVDYTPDNKKLLDFFKQVIHHPKVVYTPLKIMNGETVHQLGDFDTQVSFLPNNKYGLVLNYQSDENGEVFSMFDTYEECKNYYKKRIAEIKKTDPCGSCEFLGLCGCTGGYEEGTCRGDYEIMKFLKYEYLPSLKG